MVKGNISPSSRLGKTPPFNCDVALGLRMQQHQQDTTTHDDYSSYPSKRTMTSPPFQHHHFGGGSAFSDFCGGGGGIGGPHLFNSANNSLEGEVDMRASFTTSQRQELEGQNMIFKHLTAYRNPTSQASGMDTEPWRCRRTDGKKWRCTKDVAPDRKFCERHAHKSKKCSRKLVEIQSNNISNSQPKDTPILENPVSSIGWLMEDGSGTPPRTISQVSNCTQEQKQHQTQSSARRVLSDRDSSSHSYENPTAFQQQENDQEKQETIQWNPYMNNDYYPYFDPKVMSPSPQTSSTRHFIEAWPSDEISNKKGPFCFSSGSRELPLSTLTLSVSSGDRVVENNEPVAMKPQWTMSNISWLNSTGGPLGEALCPGNSGTGKGTSELPSPHGCSNSFSNTASSCSKGSYEDGNHQFNFFG